MTESEFRIAFSQALAESDFPLCDASSAYCADLSNDGLTRLTDIAEATAEPLFERIIALEKQLAEVQRALQDEREFTEWLQGECDKAQDDHTKAEAALAVYANESLWVEYERDGELTHSIFIGNESGLEDGVLCDGYKFAQVALRSGARSEEGQCQERAQLT